MIEAVVAGIAVSAVLGAAVAHAIDEVVRRITARGN